MLNLRERLAHVVVWTVVATTAITVLFTAMRGHTSWADIARASAGNAIFSATCVTLCVLVLPALAPWARTRLSFAAAWAVIAAALVLVGTVGSLLAMTFATLVRLVPFDRFFSEWYPDSWRTSVYFTVIFGLAATVIGELRYRLSSTTLALRTKERDEAEARRLAAEAQLASLESRVDPHFLFNTLNSIAALVRDKPNDAERVIEQLSSLMRSSLDRRQPLVPLSEELGVVRSYLGIEQIRFGDRLRFRIDAPESAHETPVPRLSLQTIVENSVKYAVSPSRDGASIAVTASRQGERMRISVEDDGPGFDAEQLPDGHGLQLLKARLAMMFSGRARVVISSVPGQTIVTLDVPVERTT